MGRRVWNEERRRYLRRYSLYGDRKPIQRASLPLEECVRILASRALPEPQETRTPKEDPVAIETGMARKYLVCIEEQICRIMSADGFSLEKRCWRVSDQQMPDKMHVAVDRPHRRQTWFRRARKLLLTCFCRDSAD